MALFVVAGAALLAYLAIRGLVVPRLARRVVADPTPASARAVAAIAVAGTVQSSCLIVGLTAAISAVGLLVLLQVRATTAPELAEAIDALRRWRQMVVGVGPYWGGAIAVLLLLAVAIHAGFRSRRRFEGLLAQLRDRETERLLSERAAGRWPDLPPTDEMLNVMAAIESARANRLRACIDSNIPEFLRDHVVQAIDERVSALQRVLILLDVQRRMNVRLDPDQVELPRPKTRWQKVQMFFISRGLFATVGAGTRALHALALVLLVPSLLGLYSVSSTAPIDRRIVEFSDLKLDLDNTDQLRKWHAAERQAQVAQRQAEETAQAAEEAAEQTAVQQVRAAEDAAAVAAAAAEREYVATKHRVSNTPPSQAAAEMAAVEEKHAQAKKDTAAARARADAERAQARDRAAAEQKAKADKAAADLDARQAAETGRHAAAKDRQRQVSPDAWAQAEQKAAANRGADDAKRAEERARAAAQAEADKAGQKGAAAAAEFRDRAKDVTVRPQWHAREVEVLAAAQKADADADARVHKAEAEQQAKRHAAELEQLEKLSKAELDARERALADKPVSDRAAAVEELKREQARSRTEMDARQAREKAALAEKHAKAATDRAARYERDAADLRTRQAAEPELANLRKSATHGEPAAWAAARSDVTRAAAAKAADAAVERLAAAGTADRAAIAGATGDRIADINRGTLDAELTAAKNRLGPPSATLTDADRAVLRDVARAYERAEAEGLRVKVEPADAFQARAAAARAAVLEQAKVVPTGDRPPLDTAPTGSRVPGLSAAEKAALATYERAFDPARDLNPAARKVFGELEDAARRQPGLVERLKGQFANFHEPVSRRGLNTRLAVTLIGAASGGAAPELAPLAVGADAEATRKMLDERSDARGKQFVHDVLGGTDLDKSLDRAATGDSDRPVVRPRDEAKLKDQFAAASDKLKSAADAARRTTAAPPAAVDRPEKGVDLKKAADATRDVAKTLVPADRAPLVAERLAESMNQYHDIAPGQRGDEGRTARGQMIHELAKLPPPPPPSADRLGGGGDGPVGGGGGGGGGGVRPPPTVQPAAQRSAFTRGRSFGGMRGFARVGGVLIGRDLTEDDPNGRPLDLRDLSWEVADRETDTVRLILTDATGVRHVSRPFYRAAVYHALTYAADGRPLAVTMVFAQPMRELWELKVLLHPTLIDSPLGYRLVELDRFVDRFTGKEVWRGAAEREVRDLDALYKVMWGYRVLGLVDGLTRLGDDEDKFHDLRRAGRAVTGDTELVAAATRGLKLVAAGRLEERRAGGGQSTTSSPLTAKPEFYDPELVNLIRDNGTERAVKDMGDRVQSAAATEVRGLNGRFDAEAKLKRIAGRWLAEPPTFDIWSGVREAAFKTDLGDLFVADGKPVPMPFRFMLQVAFTSAPAFLPAGVEAGEGYTDKTPWEFPNIDAKLHERVVAEIAKDATAREILADTAEFAVLQRLFRAGFAGRLGKEFPLERLVDLTSATAPKAGGLCRTPRWNARGTAALVARVRLQLLTLGGGKGAGADALKPALDLLNEFVTRGGKFVAEVEALEAEKRPVGKNAPKEGAIPPPRPAGWDRRWAAAWDSWSQYQDDWAERWEKATGADAFARLVKPRGGIGADAADSPTRKAAEGALLLGHLVRMRHLLNVAADDRQSAEEQLVGRKLPAYRP